MNATIGFFAQSEGHKISLTDTVNYAQLKKTDYPRQLDNYQTLELQLNLK